MTTLLLVALLAQSSPAAAPSPGPLPKSVKVVPLSAPLLESPEMLEECQKALAAAAAAKSLSDEVAAERKRIQEAYKPADKPVSDMTDTELAAWRAGREKLKTDLAAAESRRPSGSGVRERMTAEQICSDAAVATLSKGTLLTVISQRGALVNVRVETGKAVGKNGWIGRENLGPAE